VKRHSIGATGVDSIIGPGGAGMNLNNIKICTRCGLRYDWRKSASSLLKMTYCSSLCESADLGFTVDALLQARRAERPAAEPVSPLV